MAYGIILATAKIIIYFDENRDILTNLLHSYYLLIKYIKQKGNVYKMSTNNTTLFKN